MKAGSDCENSQNYVMGIEEIFLSVISHGKIKEDRSMDYFKNLSRGNAGHEIIFVILKLFRRSNSVYTSPLSSKKTCLDECNFAYSDTD